MHSMSVAGACKPSEGAVLSPRDVIFLTSYKQTKRKVYTENYFLGNYFRLMLDYFYFLLMKKSVPALKIKHIN